MTRLQNCIKCGRLMLSNDHTLCPQCNNEEIDQFKKIRDFLYQYPNASLLEISQSTEIPLQKVLAYLRQGGITVANLK